MTPRTRKVSRITDRDSFRNTSALDVLAIAAAIASVVVVTMQLPLGTPHLALSFVGLATGAAIGTARTKGQSGLRRIGRILPLATVGHGMMAAPALSGAMKIVPVTAILVGGALPEYLRGNFR